MSDWLPVFDRLERQRLEWLAQLEAAPAAAVTRAPGPGQWSPLQNVEHLILAEAGSLRYLLHKRQQGQPPPPPDAAAAWRLGLLLISLWQPAWRFRAPEPVSQPRADRSLAATAAEWAQLRAQLRQLLAELPPEWHRGPSYRHPVAGRLTLVGMLRFFEAHVARHQRQSLLTLRSK